MPARTEFPCGALPGGGPQLLGGRGVVQQVHDGGRQCSGVVRRNRGALPPQSPNNQRLSAHVGSHGRQARSHCSTTAWGPPSGAGETCKSAAGNNSPRRRTCRRRRRCRRAPVLDPPGDRGGLRRSPASESGAAGSPCRDRPGCRAGLPTVVCRQARGGDHQRRRRRPGRSAGWRRPADRGRRSAQIASAAAAAARPAARRGSAPADIPRLPVPAAQAGLAAAKAAARRQSRCNTRTAAGAGLAEAIALPARPLRHEHRQARAAADRGSPGTRLRVAGRLLVRQARRRTTEIGAVRRPNASIATCASPPCPIPAPRRTDRRFAAAARPARVARAKPAKDRWAAAKVALPADRGSRFPRATRRASGQ